MNHLYLFSLLMPEVVIVITALTVLSIDLVWTRDREPALRYKVAGSLTFIGCGIAIGCILGLPMSNKLGLFHLTPVVQLVKIAMLGLTAFTAFISIDARFTRHVGEYFAMLLLAAVGLLLLVSSPNLLMIFVALELLSVSLYAMVAFNKESLESAEAALKYFLFGSMSAAFTLFGISLLYGLTGSLDLDRISAELLVVGGEPVLYLAMVMTLVGFAFKLAAAPFHLWAPDTYQAAPTPIAAFIASGSKVGGFFILARVVLSGLTLFSGSAALCSMLAGWMPVIALIAVISMLWGNIAALVQSNVKRLLAYSAVAHAGYALLALMCRDEKTAMASLLYYVITYAMTVLGAFAVVSVVENGSGRSNLSDFAGLSRRAPVLSLCMGVFMLSLAGIPPLSGFFGKFYIFTAAVSGAENLRLLWLVILAISASAISLYYYLQVLKQVYVAQAPEQPAPLATGSFSLLAIVLLAVAVLILGCLPDLLLAPLTKALQFSAF